MAERKTSRYFSTDTSGSNDEAKKLQEEMTIVENPIDLLLLTEYNKGPTASHQTSETMVDSDSDEWEDLAGNSVSQSSQITISFNPQRLPGEQKLEENVQRQIALMWKRLKKVQASQMLKVYSLCFLAHGIYLSNLCDDALLKSQALSVLPISLATNSSKQRSSTKKKYVPQSLAIINEVLSWYRTYFQLSEHQNSANVLCGIDFIEKKASSQASYIQGLIMMFRSLSIRARLILHFWPKSLKIKSYQADNNDKPSTSSASSLQNASAGKRKQQSSPPLNETAAKKRTKNKQSAYFDAETSDVKPESKIVPFGITQPHGFNLWLEAFSSDTREWLVIDPASLCVCSPDKLECALNFAYSPTYSADSKTNIIVAYVVAFDENGKAFDVTARYASNTLHTNTRKERGDHDQSSWWKETISKLQPADEMYAEEKMELSASASAEKHPVPSTIRELHSHPLYVLARHIHKYEALYPPETQPIANVRGEPVFYRSCVHGLHTREKWLLEGKQVKPNEQPYKTVTGHRKPLKKGERERQPAKMVGLFGHWQTENYVPAPVVDGKLPRNAYGNIEVFKPWMLPTGTCHLTQQGIQSTAKRLDIDFVPAMVGWDFHAGVNHPVIDGIVVCEDVRDVLECAWRQEQQIHVEEVLTNKSNKAISNWKRLVKAMLLKERLKDRYL